MALTKAEIKSAQGCERYFDRHLNTSEYYGKTVGIWQGGLVEKLGLEREITKEAFKRVIHNLHPVTGERLTPRTNTTRIEHGWELNPETRKWEWTARAVDNQDLGWDLTFSMPTFKCGFAGEAQTMTGRVGQACARRSCTRRPGR